MLKPTINFKNYGVFERGLHNIESLLIISNFINPTIFDSWDNLIESIAY